MNLKLSTACHSYYLLTLLATLVISFPLTRTEAQTAPTISTLPASGSTAHNPVGDIDTRVTQLLAKMTLAEKIGQLQQLSTFASNATNPAEVKAAQAVFYDSIRKGNVGSILNEADPATIQRFQKIAVDESRLHVPLIFGRDVIHGFRTIFPIPLGQAASWNPKLVEQAAAIAAREARSVGIHWTFAPMVDIARDPRWGRIAEGLGEDPYLAETFSAAMVHGFQGDDLSSSDHVAACAKHFVGYGACEGGRDYNSAVISPALMRNVYLRPFHAAVEANVATLMPCFNDVNGIPGSANSHLLRDVLRKEWGFRGFVVSDWEAVGEMIVHGFCRDERDAARTAIRAGVNMEMVTQTYAHHLSELVRSGEIAESLVDELVAEVLRTKFRLGLFEQPYAPSSPSHLLSAEHLRAAQQLARESIVLLKNAHQTLPLDKSKVKKLAVIGPLADDKRAQLGTWAPDGRDTDSQTPLAALRDSAPGIEVLYAPALKNDSDRSEGGFADAIAAAQRADVVILILGESGDLSGEAHSRAILDLPGAQNALVEAIIKIGKPTVLIVEAGRPLTIGRQIEKVDAVLYSFHAGTMAGPALADLVWGIESPVGRLPVTFPKSVGQVPLYYNHATTGRPPFPSDFPRDSHIDDNVHRDFGNVTTYMDVGPYPLYPFGYGMTYTNFNYGRAELSTTKIRAGENLTIRIPITNAGKRAGDEVVQLYTHQVVAAIVRPVRELKRFQRVHIAPGETKTVTLTLPAEDLAYYDNEEHRHLDPANFELYVGGNSAAPLAGKFELVK